MKTDGDQMRPGSRPGAVAAVWFFWRCVEICFCDVFRCFMMCYILFICLSIFLHIFSLIIQRGLRGQNVSTEAPWEALFHGLLERRWASQSKWLCRYVQISIDLPTAYTWAQTKQIRARGWDRMSEFLYGMVCPAPGCMIFNLDNVLSIKWFPGVVMESIAA